MKKDNRGSIKQKSITINYLFNLVKTVCNILFPLITFTYAARVLGVEGVGKVNFAKSVTTYFMMLAMLGMNYYGTREAAKIRDDKVKLSKYVHEMLIINSVMTVLAYLLLFVSYIHIDKLKYYGSLLAINSVSILLQGVGMEWLYQALEEYRYIAVRSVVFQLIAIIAMLYLVKSEQDVYWYAAIYVLATSGLYIANFINIRKYILFKWYGRYEIKKHLKPLLWLFAMSVSIELYTVMDTTMLGFLQGDVAVGKYTAAVKANKLVNTLITSLGVVLIPRLSYYIGKGEKAKLFQLIDKSYNFVFMLSIPASMGLFVLSDKIIRLFSGKDFVSASVTMRLLTPIVLFIPFSAVTNQQTFVPMGKEKLIVLSTSIGAVTNFICNILLIPRYAENGAALATTFTELVVAIVCFHNISQFVNMKFIFNKIYQYALGMVPIPLINIVVSQLKLPYILNMIFVIIFSSICYVLILAVFQNSYFKDILFTIKNKVQNRL